MSKSRKPVIVGVLLGAVLGAAVVFVMLHKDGQTGRTGASAPLTTGAIVIGREAKPDEIAGWDIDVRPDGQGAPVGKGTVAQGEVLFNDQCASCHGEFGESAGRWPMLAGGDGTISSDVPVKTVGSYWPYASTLMDYIHRAMPYGNAQSLTNHELYAVTAYVLYLNNIIEDENFELSDKNYSTIKMPNEAHFIDDDREVTEKQFWQPPCMTVCAPGEAKIIGRARAIDVTPEAGKGPAAD